MVGAVAFRVDYGNDSYLRYCSSQAAFRQWLNQGVTGWEVAWRLGISDPNYAMTEYHIPGKWAVMTYLATDGAFRIASSTVKGDPSSPYDIDTGGNATFAGTVNDGSGRCYSRETNPLHPQPHGRTRQPGHCRQRLGTSWYLYDGAVIPGHAAAMNPSATIAGSSLRPANASEWGQNRDWALPGTWKCLGFVTDNSDDRWDDRTPCGSGSHKERRTSWNALKCSAPLTHAITQPDPDSITLECCLPTCLSRSSSPPAG
ncbi:phage tail fiber-like protein [Aeromonas salmonicida]|uniref:hypothetical protein n=1 Tax=Aeromonas salmonicida TaxID=645 RepID=UPI000E181009|nr:hypothetical protein [Aeromonas salmonicida]SUU74248.1 phage tail fiber-like protein [Aeromonas salmonicida]